MNQLLAIEFHIRNHTRNEQERREHKHPRNLSLRALGSAGVNVSSPWVVFFKWQDVATALITRRVIQLLSVVVLTARGCWQIRMLAHLCLFVCDSG
jgi:hypothetical protein